MSSYSTIKGFVLRFFALHFAASRFKLFWVILWPLFMSLGIGYVFHKIFLFDDLVRVSYIVLSFLCWQWVSSTIHQSSRLLIDNRQEVQRLGKSKDLFILSFVLYKSLIAFPGIFVCLMVEFFFLKSTLVGWGIPLAFWTLIMNFFFLLGAAHLIASWVVFWRDLLHILEGLLLFWLWSSPVFYCLSQVPLLIRPIYYLNPMTYFYQCFHGALGYETLIPVIISLPVISLLAGIILIFGWTYFKKHLREIIKFL